MAKNERLNTHLLSLKETFTLGGWFFFSCCGVFLHAAIFATRWKIAISWGPKMHGVSPCSKIASDRWFSLLCLEGKMIHIGNLRILLRHLVCGEKSSEWQCAILVHSVSDLVARHRTILRYYRCPISRDIFSARLALPKMVRYPPLYT